MPDLRLADVSEFQTVDWPAYVEPAVVIRALYGTSHVDKHWAANIAAARARAGLRVRGIYHYIVASQDIAAQAHALVALIKAAGGLRPGEFVIADIEEGTGDLRARFETWVQIVHAGLGGVEGEYSGVAFARAHLGDFAGASLVWVAAYQSNEPTDHHQLWQYTDRQSFAGISAPCDGSVFHGSIDQLYALVTGASPSPQEDPHMSYLDGAHASDDDRDGAVREVYLAVGGEEPTVPELNFCKWLLGAGSGYGTIVRGVADSAKGEAARAARNEQAV